MQHRLLESRVRGQPAGDGGEKKGVIAFRHAGRDDGPLAAGQTVERTRQLGLLLRLIQNFGLACHYPSKGMWLSS